MSFPDGWDPRFVQGNLYVNTSVAGDANQTCNSEYRPLFAVFPMTPTVLETSEFLIHIRGRRNYRQEVYLWVAATWYHPRARPYGLSQCHPGDLQRFLKFHFGSTAVGSKPHQ